MSTTQRQAVDHEPVQDVTAVRLDAESLESTSPEYLRDCRAGLVGEGLAPVELAVEARFDADSSLDTEAEADRIRGLIRAATFLGANRVVVRIDAASVPDAADTALRACAERARREGVGFEIEGPVTIDD
ncbi:hypothetical protein L593_14855 [Salinarchaeum sp. Harcht-Bsk1]|uniref:hypothetical protein n=1 Tax=Salinarchaeum sp. Harcht-Bsk1 TaxID=1333523 RepID=UPI0003423E3B|nr:hypothetical protein [Salinarchaeum sp. Harcht-Bsk1]AGN02905.1 hypothetical protein L593_14855 [Salinarchaeum sp. Harcht-Bsk1]